MLYFGKVFRRPLTKLFYSRPNSKKKIVLRTRIYYTSLAPDQKCRNMFRTEAKSRNVVILDSMFLRSCPFFSRSIPRRTNYQVLAPGGNYTVLLLLYTMVPGIYIPSKFTHRKTFADNVQQWSDPLLYYASDKIVQNVFRTETKIERCCHLVGQMLMLLILQSFVHVQFKKCTSTLDCESRLFFCVTAVRACTNRLGHFRSGPHASGQEYSNSVVRRVSAIYQIILGWGKHVNSIIL